MVDSSQVAKKLAGTASLLTASPSYLLQHCMPLMLEDLTRHQCLVYTLTPKPGEWVFEMHGGGSETITVQGRLRANISVALRRAALAGSCIINAASCSRCIRKIAT